MRSGHDLNIYLQVYIFIRNPIRVEDSPPNSFEQQGRSNFCGIFYYNQSVSTPNLTQFIQSGGREINIYIFVTF